MSTTEGNKKLPEIHGSDRRIRIPRGRVFMKMPETAVPLRRKLKKYIYPGVFIGCFSADRKKHVKDGTMAFP